MDFLARLIYVLTQVHPLHAIVVHFPIALTGAAAFFILLALVRRERILEQIAFANLSLAAASVIAAGLTGVYDNIGRYNGVAPNAGAKIILAVILFVVTAVTVLARWRKADLFEQPRTKLLYVAAYVISFVLAAILGFLGGVILYGF